MSTRNASFVAAVLVAAISPDLAIAQRTADTVVSVDTARTAPTTSRGWLARTSGGLFQRLRPADAIGLFEIGAFGHAISSTRLGGNSGLGGGLRAGVLLPYGLELEVDAGIARRPRAEEPVAPTPGMEGLDPRRFYTYSTRLLSNWDFGNRSTMFFGGGVALNDRSGAPDRTGGTAIVGYRIGEEVALRGDATVLYVPRDRWTDVGFRLGLSVALGALRGSPVVRAGRPATPTLAITRTVAVTRRDTVYRVDTVYVAAPGLPARSSSGEVSLPRPRTEDAPDASSVVVRFPYNQAVLTSAAKRDLDRWLSAWGNRVAEDSSIRVIVSGFADQCGSPDVNERVSFDRAVATQRYLVDSLHIPADRILARGLGERRLVEVRRDSSGELPDRPVPDCSSPANRRAEVRAEAPARDGGGGSGGDGKVVRRP